MNLTNLPSGIWDNFSRDNIGEYLKKNITDKSKLSFVSAYFTIYAFEALKNQLINVEELKFLFGEPSFVLDPEKTDPKEFDIAESELRLRNRLSQKTIARECADWIKEKVQIRSMNQSDFLHGKMYHMEDVNGIENAILGSSNFTLNGIGLGNKKNIELNIELNDKRDVQDLRNWFDEIWDGKYSIDVKDKILEYLEILYADTDPEFIYYLTLYHVFKKFLDNQETVKGLEEKTGFLETEVWNMLYPFQKDGVKGAINKIQTYSGCIIADSVGLGKTFEALAVIKYFELLNNRVLVLCPKKLKGTWSVFRNNDKRNILLHDSFRYDILSHTDLARMHGKSGDHDLSTIHWSNYDLVVIDESHNFRNSKYGKEDDEGNYRPSRYEFLMEEVIRKGIDTKVLLLSATPVNNTLRDLRNQIYLITKKRNDAFQDQDIKNIGGTLKRAQSVFKNWSNKKDKKQKKVQYLLEKLDSSFFKLLDQITIARSRRHVLNYYDMAEIGSFPERLKPQSESAQLDLKDRFPSYDKLDEEISNYKLSLFFPADYVKDAFYEKYDIKPEDEVTFDDQKSRERFLIGMMKINFLKRLESSVYSFGVTLERTIQRIEDTLAKIEDFERNRETYYEPDFLNNLGEDEEEEIKERLEIGTKLVYELIDLDLDRWKKDLKSDKDQLVSLLNSAESIKPERDGKLQRLKELITEKHENPVNAGNKKILIFTAYADTAKYLYRNLSHWAQKELNSHIAFVSGSSEDNKSSFKPKGYKFQTDFETILANFAPIAKQRNLMNDSMPQEGEIDILIATDCISEGQNLQDCDCVINYDIHWNPVRLIQRFGRIDRIGSPNEKIKLINFWPTKDLNNYIRLRERVEARMALVDISATGEDNLLSDEHLHSLIEDELTYRDKQLLQLKDEILDLEDMDESITLSEFTLDDFRIDLMNFLEENREKLATAPLGLNAMVPAIIDSSSKHVELGKIVKPGVIFCLRQAETRDELEKVNPLQPYFLLYIRDDGTVRFNFIHAKQILTLFQQLCKGKDKPHEALCRWFDEDTDQGKNVEKYSELLNKSVQAVVQHFSKRNLANLFSDRGGKLVGDAAPKNDLDEFELVTWLVITDPSNGNR